MRSPTYVCVRVCSVQVSCSCCLCGTLFSLRQVMSSVTSTSAGHPTRERARDRKAERIRNNRGSVAGKSLHMREKGDVLIMSPACCSTRLQHLWVTPCLHCCTILCALCTLGNVRWKSRERSSGGGTETQ